HPNILAIYDYGAAAGVSFSVMELLEGETLRTRLDRGALPWDKAVELGAAIAEGLSAAHGKGNVQRELKPANICLTSDRRIKILDFGLARVNVTVKAEAETGSFDLARTDPGSAMGTVGYMSPEQVRCQVVDARSDVFSLGCVLFELIAGQRPFPGAT